MYIRLPMQSASGQKRRWQGCESETSSIAWMEKKLKHRWISPWSCRTEPPEARCIWSICTSIGTTRPQSCSIGKRPVCPEGLRGFQNSAEEKINERPVSLVTPSVAEESKNLQYREPRRGGSAIAQGVIPGVSSPSNASPVGTTLSLAGVSAPSVRTTRRLTPHARHDTPTNLVIPTPSIAEAAEIPVPLRKSGPWGLAPVPDEANPMRLPHPSRFR